MPAAKTVPAIRGVHHTAFRCRDAAETQRFYEGVLGLPLAAALSFDEEPGTGAPLKYMTPSCCWPRTPAAPRR